MQVIDAFINVIQQQIKVIESLMTLGIEKQTLINDYEKIEDISRSEQELLADLEKYEDQRIELFDVIAPEMSLGQWLDLQPQSELHDLFADLQVKHGELQRINQINQELIQESLAFIQFNLNLFVDDSPKTYSRPGTQNVTRSIFDRKV